MTHRLAHYPVLMDARVLFLMAAVALAFLSLVTSDDSAAAGAVIHC
jgi:hypothetical protein